MRTGESGNNMEILNHRPDSKASVLDIMENAESESNRRVKTKRYSESRLILPSEREQRDSEPPNFRVLNVRVHAVQMSEAVKRLRSWITHREPVTRYVAVTGMHGIAESRQSKEFRLVLNTADLVVPDGMPLVWFARMRGFPLQRRVCGPDLMDRFCRETGAACRHFFFGGDTGVAEKLAQVLHEKHGIVIAGTYTPPFRALTDSEEKDLARVVDETSPDVFWVGLSTPKQENWMYEHRRRLRVPVMVGVGAAFDVNSGRSRRAPAWMGEKGLEWLFRLFSEPRRLWKRYLITIPKAVWFVGMELLQFQNFGSAPRQSGVPTTKKSTGEFSRS